MVMELFVLTLLKTHRPKKTNQTNYQIIHFSAFSINVQKEEFVLILKTAAKGFLKLIVNQMISDFL